MKHDFTVAFLKVKRDCVPFSVNVKVFFFAFFVMREKDNYLCVKLFSEEV